MIIPAARCALIRANMTAGHYATAACHAVWVLNRLPDASHGDSVSTPFYRIWRKKPDLSRLVIYGATAWAYLDKEVRARGKMGEVAVEGR